MILELTYARGMRIWIDGERENDTNWSYGEDENDDDIIRVSCGKDDFVRFGKHKLEAIETDVPLNGEDGEPKFVTLHFANEPSQKLKVVKTATGDPDAPFDEENPDEAGVTKVDLVNGETLMVDEITLFLRAETSDDATLGCWENRLDDWVVFQQNSRDLKHCPETVETLTQEYLQRPGNSDLEHDEVWALIRQAFDYEREPIPVTIKLTTDWTSRNGMNQNGHIEIKTKTGLIEASWECRGGKGRAPELISNTTKELTDGEAEELFEVNELWNGAGTYTAEVAGEAGDLSVINLDFGEAEDA